METRRRNGGGQNQPSTAQIQIPENVSEFYSNALNIGVTSWDFMFFFGSTQLPSAMPVGQNLVDARGR